MIEEALMSNGVRVITSHMPHVRSVSIGFWLSCGSRDDEEEASGTAHFIEHMLFKGTEKRTAKQLAQEVDCIGGQMNAFTSSEHTCYYIKVLDTHADEAFELLSDMFLHSLFAEADIKKEKQVILQEFDMYEDNPEDFIQDKFFAYIWQKHPLGRSILGSRKSIRKINRNDLAKFMAKFYTPDNLVVAVAGNVKHSEVCQFVDKYLGELSGKAEKAKHCLPEFSYGKKALYRDIEQTQVICGVPGIPINGEKWYAVNVLNNIFGASASSRLFQYIREEKGLAYFIYSMLSSYSDTGVFTINAGVKPENTKQLLALLNEQIKTFVAQGITDAELNKAKEQITSNLLMGLESSGGHMHRIGKLSVSSLPLLSIEDVVANVYNVTKENVEQVAQFLFADKSPAILQLGPKILKR